jgi:nitrogen regulatory protein P-II 1
MKKLEAIIQPYKLMDVKEALAQIGVTVLTVSEVREADRNGRHTETYRGQEYIVDFTPRVKLEVVVADGRADQTIAVISEAATNERTDAGTIFISTLEDAVTIPTCRHAQNGKGRHAAP